MSLSYLTNGETKVRFALYLPCSESGFLAALFNSSPGYKVPVIEYKSFAQNHSPYSNEKCFTSTEIVFCVALSCTCTSDCSRAPVVPCLPVSGGNLKTHRWRLLHALNRHFVAHERPDVVDSVSTDSVTRLQSGCNCQNRTHLIIVGRSSEIPHPCTCTSGGKPMGSSISGRNMPLFPTSTHLFSIG